MKYIKRNNIMKIFILFLILCLIPINTYVNASVQRDLGGSLEDYATGQAVSSRFVNRTNTIIGIIQVVGSLCSVVCLIAIGIKYLLGSAEEKADYKKTLPPYLFGAIVVLGFSNVIKVVYIIITEVMSKV